MRAGENWLEIADSAGRAVALLSHRNRCLLPHHRDLPAGIEHHLDPHRRACAHPKRRQEFRRIAGDAGELDRERDGVLSQPDRRLSRGRVTTTKTNGGGGGVKGGYRGGRGGGGVHWTSPLDKTISTLTPLTLGILGSLHRPRPMVRFGDGGDLVRGEPLTLQLADHLDADHGRPRPSTLRAVLGRTELVRPDGAVLSPTLGARTGESGEL